MNERTQRSLIFLMEQIKTFAVVSSSQGIDEQIGRSFACGSSDEGNRYID